ncbi:MMPL family transporter, partial [Mycolicibacterium holsaticum]|uniref:MMPL family transporter n=1 Tax=Mycolicibacterium holsaticum TaxID=152142 RepID=UPI000AC3E47E
MAATRGSRGAAAVVGIASPPYHKRGTSSESALTLVLKAILAACADAGADPRGIDGFVSYANDLNEGLAVGAALGVREMRWSSMVWGGGGGGVAAAINQAAAVHTMYRGTAHVVLGSGMTIAGATFCLSFTRLPYFRSLGVPLA